MAVPPMIGAPGSGGYVFYSGSRTLFEAHHDALAVPVGAMYVGEDPGFAALYDVALLSAMTGMFAGVSHAFALIRKEDIVPRDFAPFLVNWLAAMALSAYEIADHLESGDYTKGVVSNLAMMVEGNSTLLRTAEEQGVSAELLTPFMALMGRRPSAVLTTVVGGRSPSSMSATAGRGPGTGGSLSQAQLDWARAQGVAPDLI